MPAKPVSAADARARFGDLLDGVLHRGERYVVERHGREVAAIVSVAELRRLESTAPERPAGAMALVGLWHDVPDDEIDALLTDLQASRDRDTGRSIEVGA